MFTSLHVNSLHFTSLVQQHHSFHLYHLQFTSSHTSLHVSVTIISLHLMSLHHHFAHLPHYHLFDTSYIFTSNTIITIFLTFHFTLTHFTISITVTIFSPRFLTSLIIITIIFLLTYPHFTSPSNHYHSPILTISSHLLRLSPFSFWHILTSLHFIIIIHSHNSFTSLITIITIFPLSHPHSIHHLTSHMTYHPHYHPFFLLRPHHHHPPTSSPSPLSFTSSLASLSLCLPR